MKRIITLAILILHYLLASGQPLKKMPLTKEDRKDNVRWRYEYKINNVPYRETLILLKDGRYKYTSNGCLMTFFSRGKWEMTGETIVLNSDMRKDDVPFSVSYTEDTTDIVDGFKFGIVRNKKGELLTGAFVNINSDSVKCLPMAGGCGGNYSRIDSVRLIFENQYTSRWMRIDNNDKYVLLKAEIDFDIMGYEEFDNVKFRIKGNLLIHQVEKEQP